MDKRIHWIERTRETLLEPIESRLSSPDAHADLVRLATRPIVEVSAGKARWAAATTNSD